MTGILGNEQEIAEKLRVYTLSSGVLPEIAERRLFASHTVEALESAVAFTHEYPESRGTMAHIIRRIAGLAPASDISDAVTMEAHLDATLLPQKLADAAIALGFGPDPFAKFNPAHYADHYTLKFKVPASSTNRRAHLTHLMQEKCETLFKLLQADADLKEAYIELEVYHNALNRRRWDAGEVQKQKTEEILPACILPSIDPPRSAQEAGDTGLPLDIAKQADIHVKLAKGIGRYPLIEQLCEKGFYHVRTGAGNDVLTAQFAAARDAKNVFGMLENYFDRHGGCAEMTLEPVRNIWRTYRADESGQRHYAAMPPLVLRLEKILSYDAAAMTERN